MALRIGLIGCGFIGRFHSSAIRGLIKLGLIEAEYAAVCDLAEERARTFADFAGVPWVSSDPFALLDSPDIDVVYICVPTAYHKDLVLRAAQRGKHIFCEKPLATSLADVCAMADAVQRAGVGAGVGLVLRHSPVYTVLGSLSEDASLGRLMAIVFRDDQFFPIHSFYQSDWRKDYRLAGSGTLLEHSIHDLDLLRWFGGEVATVRGTVAYFAGHHQVEDLAVAHLEFESGAQAILVSIWHNVLGRPSTRRLELFFENGVFFTDHDLFGPIHCQTHANPVQTISGEEVRRRYLELVDLPGPEFDEALRRFTLEDYFFLTALAEGRQPFPDFPTALRAHELVDAVYRSASIGGEAVHP